MEIFLNSPLLVHIHYITFESHRIAGSGCRALLMNDSFEDLARMYKLFSRLPEGLPPMAGDVV